MVDEELDHGRARCRVSKGMGAGFVGRATITRRRFQFFVFLSQVGANTVLAQDHSPGRASSRVRSFPISGVVDKSNNVVRPSGDAAPR